MRERVRYALSLEWIPEIRLVDGLRWSIPVAVWLMLRYQRYLPSFTTQRACGAILAVGLVLWGVRRTEQALTTLLLVLPFQTFLSAWLVARGVSFDLVRLAGYWKEAVAVGVAIAGYRGYMRRGRTLDAIDHVAMVYVALVGLYALLPRLFAPEAPLDGTLRYVGFRQQAGFVILFLAARHAVLPDGALRRLCRVAISVAAATAAIALYEFWFSNSWNTFLVDTIQLPRYQLLLGTKPASFTDLRIYSEIGGTKVLRVQSVFGSLSYGFYLVPAVALLVARMVTRRPGSRSGPLLLLIGTALLLTETRSAQLAIAIVVVLTLLFRPDRRVIDPAGKARLGLLLIAACILAIPLAASSGLLDRLTGSATGTDTANQEHQDSLHRGWADLREHALGNGLGTAAGTGQRFGTDVVVADNTFLSVGNEVGILPMLLFGTLLVLVIVRLRRPRDRASPEVAALSHALFGIAVGGFLLQVWLDLSIAWSFWILAGPAVAVVDRLRAEPPQDGMKNALKWSPVSTPAGR